MSKSPISVVVPAYNEEDSIGSCIDHLESQDYPEDIEIIIIDNNSSDSTATIVKNRDAKLVIETNKGSYAARNKGIQEASYDIIAFTDADSCPPDDWISNGVSQINSGYKVVTGPIQFSQTSYETLAAKYDIATGFKGKGLKTANLFVEKNVFKSIGKFNQNLISGGDVEWGNRVNKSEYEMYYSKDVVVEHPPRKNFRELMGKSIRTGYGAGQKDRMQSKNAYSSNICLRLIRTIPRPLIQTGWKVKIIYRNMNPFTKQGILFTILTFCLNLYSYYGYIHGYLDGVNVDRVGDYGD